MSQSDWNFTLKNESYTFIGGTSGSAKLHTDLTNPLTHSGDWCRQFVPTSDTHYSIVSMIPINNSELTSSSGYQYGDSYSVRCWIRAEQMGGYTKSFIIFKGTSDLSLGGLNLESDYPFGYVLEFDGSRQLKLRASTTQRIGWSDSLSPTLPYYGYAKTIINNSGPGIPAATWKGYRMDVMPISGAYDKITVYTAERTSPNTWDYIDSVEIPRTKPGAYIPWANNPNGDGAAAAGYGYIGIVGLSMYPSYPLFIDLKSTRLNSSH